jgi:hypothetical protein
MTIDKLKHILDQHKKWLMSQPYGARADLNRANLNRADLRGADLDFSCWPLWCGSFCAKVDDRLVWQLIAHVTRLDIAECSDDAKTAISAMMPFANRFCKYRNDVQPI